MGKLCNKMGRLLIWVLALLLMIMPEAYSQAESFDSGKECDITVDAVGEKNDLKPSQITVDLYKIADMVEDEKTDGFTYGDPEKTFASLGDLNGTDIDWEEMNDKAAALIKSHLGDVKPVASASSGHKIDGLKPGLYMYVIHKSDAKDGYFDTGDGKQIVTKVTGSKKNYWYTPALVLVPGKDDEAWIYSYSGDNTIIPKQSEKLKPTHGNPPKTGDQTDMRPYFIVLGVSSVLIVLLAVLRVKSGRKTSRADEE
ncbi:MAG: hypothetical protein K6A77_11785 [Clostridiales bacterium]|nr:hypothetical protein [Clostridiales bacterium]